MPNAEDQKKRKFLTNLFVDQLISKLHTGEPCVCQLYRAKNSLSSIQPILGQCMSPKVFFRQKSRALYCRTDKKNKNVQYRIIGNASMYPKCLVKFPAILYRLFFLPNALQSRQQSEIWSKYLLNTCSLSINKSLNKSNTIPKIVCWHYKVLFSSGLNITFCYMFNFVPIHL